MIKGEESKLQRRHVDVTATFSTSLNSSINRDEDLENKMLDNTHTRIYKANTLRKTSKTNINNLENSFDCFILEFLSV